MTHLGFLAQRKSVEIDTVCIGTQFFMFVKSRGTLCACRLRLHPGRSEFFAQRGNLLEITHKSTDDLGNLQISEVIGIFKVIEFLRIFNVLEFLGNK